MKTGETARKMMTYFGAGAGLVLFAIMGLLPGSLLGGVVGLNMAGGLFGFPVSSELMPRLIVGMSMVIGIIVSAVLFLAGGSSLGWLIGCLIDATKVERAAEAHAKH